MEKKVLIIMTTPLGKTGISSMVLNYFKFFKHQDIKYEFVVWNDVDSNILNEINEKGGLVHKLPHRLNSPIKYSKYLYSLMKKRDIDLVHAHGNSATLFLEMNAARKAGVKFRIAHSHSTQCKFKTIHYLLKPMFFNSYTLALACSEQAGKWLFKHDYKIITNGIELDEFKYKGYIREKTRLDLNIKDNKVIGMIGSFVPVKNHIFMLNIVADLIKVDKSIILMLIGDGELREEIHQKIIELDISKNVMLLGIRKDVSQLLQAMDIFVLPSIYEGLPFVAVEAQAAGLPCYISQNVSKEVKLTDSVNFISLNKPSEWVNMINSYEFVDREVVSEKSTKQLHNKNYEIKEEARKLEEIYCDLMIGNS